MNVLRIALALVLGVAIGGGVNMALVILGPTLIAPPPGADMGSAEGLRAAMPLLEPRHFVMPFPAPAWFIVLDLVAAYIPMAWLGLSIANRLSAGAAK